MITEKTAIRSIGIGSGVRMKCTDFVTARIAANSRPLVCTIPSPYVRGWTRLFEMCSKLPTRVWSCTIWGSRFAVLCDKDCAMPKGSRPITNYFSRAKQLLSFCFTEQYVFDTRESGHLWRRWKSTIIINLSSVRHLYNFPTMTKRWFNATHIWCLGLSGLRVAPGNLSMPPTTVTNNWLCPQSWLLLSTETFFLINITSPI